MESLFQIAKNYQNYPKHKNQCPVICSVIPFLIFGILFLYYPTENLFITNIANPNWLHYLTYNSTIPHL